jgi:hypothetical protein
MIEIKLSILLLLLKGDSAPQPGWAVSAATTALWISAEVDSGTLVMKSCVAFRT